MEREVLESVHDAPARPDALAVLLEVRAQDAGQEEDRGTLRVARRSPKTAAVLARERARPNRQEIRRLVERERVRERLGGVAVPEIRKMTNVAALRQEK